MTKFCKRSIKPDVRKALILANGMIGVRPNPPHPVKRRRVDKSVKLKKGDVRFLYFWSFYFVRYLKNVLSV